MEDYVTGWIPRVITRVVASVSRAGQGGKQIVKGEEGSSHKSTGNHPCAERLKGEETIRCIFAAFAPLMASVLLAICSVSLVPWYSPVRFARTFLRFLPIPLGTWLRAVETGASPDGWPPDPEKPLFYTVDPR